MASTPQNNHAGGPRLAIVVPFASTVAFNQGDIAKVSSNAAAPVAAVSDVVFGIFDETNPTASLADKVTAATVIRPDTGTLCYFTLKSGDTANFNDQLYISSNVATNPQEVSTSSANSASKVGFMRELVAVTGDGTKRVLVEFVGAGTI